MALGQVSPGPDMLDIGSDYTRMHTIQYLAFFWKNDKNTRILSNQFNIGLYSHCKSICVLQLMSLESLKMD